MPGDVPNPSSDFLTEIRKLRACLQSVDFLDRLKLDELDKLMDALKRRRYPAGQIVIKQGERGDAFYMIASGTVSVWDKDKQVATRYPGEYFGEGALVTESPRSATVKTESATELYILYKEDFKKILMANAGINASIKAHIAKLKAGPR